MPLRQWACEGIRENDHGEKLIVTYDPAVSPKDSASVCIRVGEHHAIWITPEQAFELDRILSVMRGADAGIH